MAAAALAEMLCSTPRLRPFGLALASTLLLICAQVKAQPADPEQSVAATLSEQGEQFATEGRLLEARDALQRSVWAKEKLETLLSLADVELRLDLLRSALSRLERLEEHTSIELDGPLRTRVLSLREAVTRRFAQLKLHLQPADATVRVDGEALRGGAERTSLIEPGEHDIDVSAQGYERVRLAINAEAQDVVEQEIRLRLTVAWDLSRLSLDEPVDPAIHAREAAGSQRRILLGLSGAVIAGLILTTTVLAVH